jgi:hypothetical protein
MSQYREQLPKTVKVKCTDNDKVVDADLWGYQEKKYIDVTINTVRVRLNYTGKLYVGNMAGYEFTAQAPEIVVFKQHR